ncbi:MAG TPA: class I SAM-dependent methyltransferase [Thermomicrobiales bacterium]|nr:class I SAM-dependent methyltransferase [Thermomicrobiales bacterium]
MTRTAEAPRRDVVWQAAATTANYHRSRRGIPYAEDQFDITRRVLEAHRVEVRSLLDLGCGDGIATQAMLDRVSVERAVLVDFSEPMLEAARERFRESPLVASVINGDLLGSAWVDVVRREPGYDLVISRFAIHHLPHDRKHSLYAEIFDLLRPGGMFINIEHVQSPTATYQDAFERMLIEGIHALHEDRETIEETERAFRARQDAETNILAPVEDQCAWLREIGFADVDCSFKAFELAVFGGRRPDIS